VGICHAIPTAYGAAERIAARRSLITTLADKPDFSGEGGAMKRPWKKVVRTTEIEQTQPYHNYAHQQGPKTVMLWRLYLSCGHFVDVRRHNGLPPMKWQCCLCQHGHVPKASKLEG